MNQCTGRTLTGFLKMLTDVRGVLSGCVCSYWLGTDHYSALSDGKSREEIEEMTQSYIDRIDKLVAVIPTWRSWFSDGSWIQMIRDLKAERKRILKAREGFQRYYQRVQENAVQKLA